MATLKNTVVSDTGFIQLPNGNVNERPGSPSTGALRFNSEYGQPEVYTSDLWTPTAENTDTLIADFDSIQFKMDYKPRLLPVENWRLGNASETFFGQNGATAENRRIWSTDPFGNDAICWDTPSNDSNSNADGGWNSSNVNIDYFRFHRHTVWIKRPIVGNGSTYLGLRSNDGVDNRSSGNRTTNPYHYSGGWSSAYGTDEWVLFVGFTWPYKSGTGNDHPETGIYNLRGERVGSCRDYVYRDGATRTMHRSYLFYSTDTNTSQRWWEPRIDTIDGTEPSLSDLLSNRHNKWKNIAGKSDATAINWPVYNDSEEAVQFDGNNEYFAVPWSRNELDVNNAFTISIVYKFSGSTGATYQTLVGDRNGDFFIGKDTANTNIGVQDGNYINNVATGTNAWDGNWHQITYTLSGTTGTIYLDGVNVGSGTFTGATGGTIMHIGAEALNYFFTGYMRQVRFYTSALSAAEVRKNYEFAKRRYGI